jgi:hypothetical protein
MRAHLTKVEFEGTLHLSELEIVVLQHFASYGGAWMHAKLSERFSPETVDRVMSDLRAELGKLITAGAAAREVRAS